MLGWPIFNQPCGQIFTPDCAFLHSQQIFYLERPAWQIWIGTEHSTKTVLTFMHLKSLTTHFSQLLYCMVTNYRLSYVSTGYSAQFCMHLFLASDAGGREIPVQMSGVVCREVKFGALTAVTSQCLQWADILTAVLLMECKQHLQHLQNVYAILSTHWLMCSIKRRERERKSVMVPVPCRLTPR